jgi:hypothetical protein
VAPLRPLSAKGFMVSLASAVRMHADELDIDAPLVRRLLGAQLPDWADLPLEPVEDRRWLRAVLEDPNG